MCSMRAPVSSSTPPSSRPFFLPALCVIVTVALGSDRKPGARVFAIVISVVGVVVIAVAVASVVAVVVAIAVAAAVAVVVLAVIGARRLP